MATASFNNKTFSPQETRSLLECPVCVQTFKNPKSLPCGHSVCADCCRLLNRERVHLVCPVCRQVSNISAESLPINFGLRDLVQHYVESVGLKSFTCGECNKKSRDEYCWKCSDCNGVVCCNCALKNHKNHELQEIKQLVADRANRIREWRSTYTSIKQDVDQSYRQINLNRLKLEQNGHRVNITLRTKLIPKMEAVTAGLKQQLQNFEKQLDELNPSILINEELTTGQESNKLESLTGELQSLKEKQTSVVTHQNEALEALKKCTDDLVRIALLYTSEGERQSVPDRSPAFGRRHAQPRSAAAAELTEESLADVLDRAVREVTPLSSGSSTISRSPVIGRRPHFSALWMPPRLRYGNADDVSSDEETPAINRNQVIMRQLLPVRRHAVPSQVSSPANARVNQEAVVVVEDDSVEEMDVAAGPSSDRRSPLFTGGISAKRLRRAAAAGGQTTETSSDSSSDDDQRQSHRAVDSTISFRILHKAPRNQ